MLWIQVNTSILKANNNKVGAIRMFFFVIAQNRKPQTELCVCTVICVFGRGTQYWLLKVRFTCTR